MRAAWWWIDRWRKSTAYTDMTLAEQGAYRNLLDELWLRDGTIPNDERILAKLCGDATEWPNVREKVMARFTLTPGGWRHPTHDEVSAQSRAYRDAQADAGRARTARAKRDKHGRLQPASPAGKSSRHQPESLPEDQPDSLPTDQPPSPSPSPSPISVSGDIPSPSAPASSKPRKEPEGDHPELIRRFQAEWSRCRGGQAYQVQPKDGVAASKLLKLGTPDEIMRRATRMLESPEAFYARAQHR